MNRKYKCSGKTCLLIVVLFSSFILNARSADITGNSDSNFRASMLSKGFEGGSEEPMASKLTFLNYPNPFSGTTTISYELPVEGFVKLDIYNLIGMHIATLVKENQSAGAHTLLYDASGLPQGTYFCKINSGKLTGILKLILIK